MKNFFKRFGLLILPALWAAFMLFAVGMNYMAQLANTNNDSSMTLPLMIAGVAMGMSVLLASAMNRKSGVKLLIPSAILLVISVVALASLEDGSLPAHLIAALLVVIHYVLFFVRTRSPRTPKVDPQLAAMQQEMEKMRRMMEQMQSGVAQPEAPAETPSDPKVAAMEQELAQMRQMMARFEQQAEPQKPAKPEGRKESAKGFIIVMLVVYILATVAGFIAGYYTQYLPSRTMDRAFELKEAGEYRAAAELFESLDHIYAAKIQAEICWREANATPTPEPTPTPTPRPTATPKPNYGSYKIAPWCNFAWNATPSQMRSAGLEASETSKGNLQFGPKSIGEYTRYAECNFLFYYEFEKERLANTHGTCFVGYNNNMERYRRVLNQLKVFYGSNVQESIVWTNQAAQYNYDTTDASLTRAVAAGDASVRATIVCNHATVSLRVDNLKNLGAGHLGSCGLTLSVQRND